MNKGLLIEGKQYIPASRGARDLGYSPDYVSELARTGKVPAKLIGRAWYVDLDALIEYKKSKGGAVPVLAATEPSPAIDAHKYIPTKKAARRLGYTQDYVGELARSGRVPARLIGRSWHVDFEALLEHKRSRGAVSAPLTLDASPAVPLLPAPEAALADILPALEKPRALSPWMRRAEQSIVALVALAIIASSSAYALDYFSPSAAASFSARFARSSQAFALSSLWRKQAEPAVDPGTPAVETVRSIADGAPSGMPVSMALENLRRELEAEFAAYAKTRIAQTVRVPAPQSIPSVVYNQTFTILTQANAHTSKQGEAIVTQLSQSLGNIQVNGTITNPAISGGTIKRASITDSSFSGGTITLGQNDTATLPNLAFGIASGTSATTTNLFSTNAELGGLVVDGSASVHGALDVGGNTVTLGQLISTRVPTLPHSFSAWPAGTSNASDATIFINPATAGPDTNIFAAAVGNQVRFLVDAEGDVYANNLVLSGSVSQGETTIAGNLTVQDNTTLGDASTDTITLKGQVLALASTTLQTLTFQSATGTSATTTNLYSAALTAGNATTTNFFSTTASSTNLFSTNATLGTLTAGPITSGLVNGQTISSAANFTGSLTATGGLTTLSNLLLTGSTTLQNFTFTSATGTSATTTNLFTTNLVGTSALFTGATTTSLFSTTASSTNLFTSAFNADNGTLFVDTTNHRVGVGTTLPGVPLDVVGAIRTSDGGTGRLVTSITSNAGSLRAIGSVSDTLDLGGASYLTLSTYASGWQERVRVTNGGSVGIGKTNPSTALDVAGTASSTGLQVNGNAAVTGTITSGLVNGQTISSTANFTGSLNVAGNVGIGVTNPAAKLQTAADNAGAWDLGQILASGSTNTNKRLSLGFDTTNNLGFIQSLIAGDNYYALSLNPHGGNVGIGTTNPARLLTVNGGAATSRAIFQTTASGASIADGLDVGLDTSGNAFIWNYETGPIEFGTSNNERARIDAAGNMGVGSTTPAYKLSVDGSDRILDLRNSSASAGNALLRFSTTGGDKFSIGYNDPSTDSFIIYDDKNSAYRFLIDNSGKVGIGVTNPTQRFQVAGNIFADGATAGADTHLYLNNTSNNTKVDLNTNGNSYLIGGNLGIGTTNPGYSLEISQPAAGGAQLTLTNPTALNGTSEGGSAQDIGALNFVSADTSTSQGGVIRAQVKAIPGEAAFGTGGALTLSTWPTYAGPGSSLLERMRITPEGNVGIGVTNPQAKLQVHDGTNNNIWMRTGGAGLETQIIAVKDDNSTYQNLALDGAKLILNGQTGGNVGIGTTGPGALLDIGGTNNKNFLVNSGATTGYAYMTVSNTGGNLLTGVSGSTGAFWGDGAMGAYSSTIGTSVATNLVFATNNAQRLTILSGGNVGIGTTNPGAKLDVAGQGAFSSGIAVTGGTGAAGTVTYNGAYGLLLQGKTGATADSAIFTPAGSIVWDNPTGTLNSYFQGNVGIGTTNPSGLLHIKGNTAGSGPEIWYEDTNTGGHTYRLGGNSSAGNFALYDSTIGSYRWTVNSAGSFGIGTTNPLQNFVVSNGGHEGIEFVVPNGANTDLIQAYNRFTSAYDALNFAAASFDFQNGNVGIGVANSPSRLSVVSSNGGNDLTFTNDSAGNYRNSIGNTQSAGAAAGNSMYFNVGDSGLSSQTRVMTLLGNGNVGIGITNPNVKLEVNGGILTYDSSGTGDQLAIQQTLTGAGRVQLKLYSHNEIGTLDLYDGNNAVQTHVVGNGTSYFNGGNVGIGVTNPNAKFDVRYDAAIDATTPGTAAYGAIHLVPTTGTNDNSTGISFGANSTGSVNQGVQAGIYVQSSGSYGTKMRFATTDSYGTGAKTRMTIDHLGNVGIAVTNPSATLQVGGGVFLNTTQSDTVLNGSITSTGIYGAGAYWGIRTATNRSFNLDMFNGGSPVTALTALTGGSIGIGVTSPRTPLDVAGEISLQAAADAGVSNRGIEIIPGTFSGSNIIQAWNNSGGTLTLASGNTGSGLFVNKLIMDPNTGYTSITGGNVGIGTTNPQQLLDVNGNIITGAQNNVSARYDTSLNYHSNLRWNSLQLGNNGANDLVAGRTAANGYFRFFVNNTNDTDSGTAPNGTLAMTISSSGNVGIGTTNPSSILTVNGSVTYSNSVRASGTIPSGGTAGCFQITDASHIIVNSATTPVVYDLTADTGDVVVNSTRGGTHSIVIGISTTGCNAGYYALNISPAYTGQSTGDSYTLYSPVGGLGNSTSGFTSGIFAVDVNSIFSTVTGGFDLAEQYQTTDQTLEDGDVVSIDPLLAEGVRKSAPGEVAPLGIISEHAPLTLGDNGPGWKKVALAGRVDAKVSDENGTIAPGDFLAPSAREGGKLAKAVRAGMVLGQALEAEHAGVVKIFTNRFFYDPAEATTTASTTSERVAALEVRVSSLESLIGTSTPSALTLDATTSDALASGVWASASLALRQGIQSLGQVSVIHNALYAVSGIFDKVFAREVHTDLICVTDANGQTCVNRSQLDSMLAAGGQSGTVSGVQAPTAPAQTSAASSTSDATASSTPSTDTSTATSTPSTTDTASSTPSTTQTDTSASSTLTDSTVASAPSDTTSVTP